MTAFTLQSDTLSLWRNWNRENPVPVFVSMYLSIHYQKHYTLSEKTQNSTIDGQLLVYSLDSPDEVFQVIFWWFWHWNSLHYSTVTTKSLHRTSTHSGDQILPFSLFWGPFDSAVCMSAFLIAPALSYSWLRNRGSGVQFCWCELCLLAKKARAKGWPARREP